MRTTVGFVRALLVCGLMTLILRVTGPEFAYPPPQVEGCPPARAVAELSGPPDDLAFPLPDTEIGALSPGRLCL